VVVDSQSPSWFIDGKTKGLRERISQSTFSKGSIETLEGA
jgi:hypothetical protein